MARWGRKEDVRIRLTRGRTYGPSTGSDQNQRIILPFMKTFLVLSQGPELPEAIRGALNPEQFRVLQRATFEEAEPFLSHGLTDGCIIDMEVADVQTVWLLEKIRRRAPKIPVIIYTNARQSDWEEEAYLHGANQD